jgi:hypothetical protein
MGWLARTLGIEKPLGGIDVSATLSREERVNVVGESNYQPAILKACGAKVGEGVRYECLAELEPEPTNEYDPNAICVKIEGRCVGYLSREDAVKYGPAIKGAVKKGQPLCVSAVVAGRGEGAETTNLGVFLSLMVAD